MEIKVHNLSLFKKIYSLLRHKQYKPYWHVYIEIYTYPRVHTYTTDRIIQVLVMISFFYLGCNYVLIDQLYIANITSKKVRNEFASYIILNTVTSLH